MTDKHVKPEKQDYINALKHDAKDIGEVLKRLTVMLLAVIANLTLCVFLPSFLLVYLYTLFEKGSFESVCIPILAIVCYYFFLLSAGYFGFAFRDRARHFAKLRIEKEQ